MPDSSSTLLFLLASSFLRFPCSKLLSMLSLIQLIKESIIRASLPLFTPLSRFVKWRIGFVILQLLLQKRLSCPLQLKGFFKLKQGLERSEPPLSDGTIVRVNGGEIMGGRRILNGGRSGRSAWRLLRLFDLRKAFNWSTLRNTYRMANGFACPWIVCL